MFRPDGTPLSRDSGLTAGPISWPQGTMSDREGNISIANCAADSVTVYPKGRPRQAFEIPIPPPAGASDAMKPFGIAIDHQGNAWTTGSFNSTLAVTGPEGSVLEVIHPVVARGRTQLRRPMGVSLRQSREHLGRELGLRGRAVPAQPAPGFRPGHGPLLALFLSHPRRTPHVRLAVHRGQHDHSLGDRDRRQRHRLGRQLRLSLFSPSDPISPWPAPNRVSHFCGSNPSKCPPTKREVGRAISPEGTGYTSDALVRNTGVAIDPSGNVWLANDWKKVALVNNPGGNAIVVLVGAAAPVRTPLIGTPRPFDGRPGGWEHE